MNKTHAHTSNEDISESSEDVSCIFPPLVNRDDAPEGIGDASESVLHLNNNKTSTESFDLEIDYNNMEEIHINLTFYGEYDDYYLDSDVSDDELAETKINPSNPQSSQLSWHDHDSL